MKRLSKIRTFCDLTQSYSAKGGGIRTYLTEKRNYILSHSDARHVLIVSGASDRIIQEGRLTTIEIRLPCMPGSPNYRLLLRSRAVLQALRSVQPDCVECLDAYNLPWAAIYYRKKYPETALIAGYRTDFPTVYIEKYTRPVLGRSVARGLKKLGYKYGANLYRRFDAFYALNEFAVEKFSALGVSNIQILPLGVDTEQFHPNKRSFSLRAELGMREDAPLLIYAGRIDREKKTRIVVDAFKTLPANWGAGLVMLGDGSEREAFMQECAGLNAHFPGFVAEREILARYLASSDIYISAMEDETFGISILEAQSTGLPIVGVRAGAMVERAPSHLGRLGAPGDAHEMAGHISKVWMDRPSSMRSKARQHVLDNYSWATTFDHLFGEIYPAALMRRAPHKLCDQKLPQKIVDDVMRSPEIVLERRVG
jgi:alpha-1,6-mannosyltransferase